MGLYIDLWGDVSIYMDQCGSTNIEDPCYKWKQMEDQYGGVLKWRYPKMDSFLVENPTKMDDLGFPHFRGHLHIGNM